MKKTLLTITFFCFSIFMLNAQFSAQAGFNIAVGDFTLGTANLSDKPLFGFNAGITGDLQIHGPLYLNIGLMYTQKGTHFEILTKGANFLIDYIEVPLNLKAKYDLGKASVFAQAGVYGAYALSNTMKYDDSDIKDFSMDFGTDEDTMKRYDVGYNVGGGLDFGKIQLILNYGEGFSSIYNQIENIPSTIVNKVFSVSAAFQF
jgi:hypothetical protein